MAQSDAAIVESTDAEGASDGSTWTGGAVDESLFDIAGDEDLDGLDDLDLDDDSEEDELFADVDEDAKRDANNDNDKEGSKVRRVRSAKNLIDFGSSSGSSQVDAVACLVPRSAQR